MVARVNAESLTLAPTDQLRMHSVYRSASTLRKRATSSAPYCQGLILGGACLRANEEASTRGHVHCVAAFPNRRSGFACFRKPGVSVYMKLNVQDMILDGILVYCSARGALLIPYNR